MLNPDFYQDKLISASPVRKYFSNSFGLGIVQAAPTELFTISNFISITTNRSPLPGLCAVFLGFFKNLNCYLFPIPLFAGTRFMRTSFSKFLPPL
ncbi:MAG: hypothetical protein DPW20_17905 [Candidatus Brocadia sp.]|nr:MAG: hypothetical protein EDM70_18405 [Candidatus Brocadia sp. AMX2]MBC6934091.1 hypothetical protein [Candidatus Brocadia sp.]MBL1170730.1 hypothetical protein [Candidatus Brocadia sp. AMX1]MCQ3919210.1 hypothetical protein [Candidatus Brocadia sp.]RIJ88580.1 MAG: hypothetical protein DB853_17640 [Candidatus Brocadia sp.]